LIDGLRTAHHMFTVMAGSRWAGRQAQGGYRRPAVPQEAHIVRLVREELSNQDIGARLFLSPRTVELHLSKIFAKLGIT
jgi:DNA-binding NarL/FixJ family response regulator